MDYTITINIGKKTIEKTIKANDFRIEGNFIVFYKDLGEGSDFDERTIAIFSKYSFISGIKN